MKSANGLSLSVGVLVFWFSVISSSGAQQQRIEITSPADGSVITSGQTITITVSADPTVQVIGVLNDGRFPDLQPGSSSNQFLQTIPATTTPGIYHLTAIGMTASEGADSAPITIDVEPQFSPITVEGSPTVLAFTGLGGTLSIRAVGTFSDGSKLDLTRSSRTSYASKNPQVATVDSRGIVTAVGAGHTAIMIQSGLSRSLAYAAVFVQVPQPPPTGIPPVVTSATPTHGIPGATQVTVTGSGFGAIQGSGSLLLGSRDATTINSWSDTRIVATVAAGSRNGIVEVMQNGLHSNIVPFTVDVPVIEGVSAGSAPPGARLTITGTGFAAQQGQGSVLFGTARGTVVSWSDTKIVVTVPSAAAQGTICIHQKGVESNRVYFHILPRPEGQ